MPKETCLRTGFTVLLAFTVGLSLTGSALAKDSASSPAKSSSKVVSKESSKAQSKDKDNSSDTKSSAVSDLSDIPPVYKVELDKKTYKLVNQGRWKDALERLEKLTAKETYYTQNSVWQAFAYMFFNKKEELDALSKRLKVNDSDSHTKAYKTLVDSYHKVTEGKKKEAAKLLKGIASRHRNDATVNFAIAAIAGKNGNTPKAVEFLKRATELDPEFGWAYRGLGYVEYKWLGRKDLAEKHLSKALEIEPNNNEVRTLLARILLGRNDFDGAIEIAKEAIKLDKKNPKNHLRLAQIYRKQWRFKEASSELDTAIKLAPEEAIYYRNRAGVRLSQSDFKAAISDQTKAVALSSSKSFDLIALAKMNVRSGDTDAGIANLKEAIEKAPKSKAAHKQLTALLFANKRWDELVDELKRVKALVPKNGNVRYDLAQALMQAKRYDEAVTEYKNASNLNPKDPRPLRQLGTYFSEQKEYARAIKAFRKALNINPTSVQDMVALGYCFAQDDNYRQSEAAFVTALALKQLTKQNDRLPPSRADIIRTLASLLLIEGRYVDARNQFESLYGMTRSTKAQAIDAFLLNEANALSSRSKKDIKKMIHFYHQMSKKEQFDYRYSFIQALIKLDELDEATSQFAKITDKEFKAEPKWNILSARLQRALGEYDVALKTVESAIESSKKIEKSQASVLADALVERARIEFAKGDLDKAESTANHALETYTKTFASYLVLAKVNYKRSKYKESIEFLNKALEQNPYLTEAYLLIGDSYMKLDDAKSAVENYSKACEIYPGYIKAHRSLAEAYKKLGKEDLAQKELFQIKNMLESK